MKLIGLIISIIFLFVGSAIAEQDYVLIMMNLAGHSHDHQTHPAPANKVCSSPHPYHPYFHEHGNYGIHQHGTEFGHNRYNRIKYARHFSWEDWGEVRHCYENGIYHMDDDNNAGAGGAGDLDDDDGGIEDDQ